MTLRHSTRKEGVMSRRRNPIDYCMLYVTDSRTSVFDRRKYFLEFVESFQKTILERDETIKQLQEQVKLLMEWPR